MKSWQVERQTCSLRPQWLVCFAKATCRDFVQLARNFRLLADDLDSLQTLLALNFI